MNNGKCIISGYVAGQKFRPSNWSERLCETGAAFDPLKRIMRYSKHFYPRQCDRYGCSVFVNFDAIDHALNLHITRFIETHSLEVISLQPIKLECADKRITHRTEFIRRNKAA